MGMMGMFAKPDMAQPAVELRTGSSVEIVSSEYGMSVAGKVLWIIHLNSKYYNTVCAHGMGYLCTMTTSAEWTEQNDDDDWHWNDAQEGKEENKENVPPPTLHEYGAESATSPAIPPASPQNKYKRPNGVPASLWTSLPKVLVSLEASEGDFSPSNVVILPLNRHGEPEDRLDMMDHTPLLWESQDDDDEYEMETIDSDDDDDIDSDDDDGEVEEFCNEYQPDDGMDMGEAWLPYEDDNMSVHEQYDSSQDSFVSPWWSSEDRFDL